VLLIWLKLLNSEIYFVLSRLDPLEVLNSTQTNVSIHTALTDRWQDTH